MLDLGEIDETALIKKTYGTGPRHPEQKRTAPKINS
jgi:hypothetical protein